MQWYSGAATRCAPRAEYLCAGWFSGLYSEIGVILESGVIAGAQMSARGGVIAELD